MRIVIVANYYASSMGYLQNCLPIALSRLGHDVTVIASTLQPYGLSPFYEQTYEPFLGPPIVAPGKSVDRGVPIIRLPYLQIRGRLGIKGLSRQLHQLRPDVVEVVDHASISALQAAWLRDRVGFKLFTANHILASVFPPARDQHPGVLGSIKMEVLTRMPGRLINRMSEACFAPTDDAGEIAMRFFGVSEEKVRYLPLGVDTEIFHPASRMIERQRRKAVRDMLGIGDDEILCIYTGRFTKDKDPALLARAVELLRSQGHHYAALFIGQGEQLEMLAGFEGSTVIPFMKSTELASYYRAADIGVWPRQESTSMMDASACGIPIIVSDRIRATHRVLGSGLMYKESEVESLITALLNLQDDDERERMGRIGSQRMANQLSWNEIARRRADAYRSAVETTMPLNYGTFEGEQPELDSGSGDGKSDRTNRPSWPGAGRHD